SVSAVCATLFFFLLPRPPPRPTLFPYTTLFRSSHAGPHRARRGCRPAGAPRRGLGRVDRGPVPPPGRPRPRPARRGAAPWLRSQDRKSTRLNSSHSQISYAVFCLKKKKTKTTIQYYTRRLPADHTLTLQYEFLLSMDSENALVFWCKD